MDVLSMNCEISSKNAVLKNKKSANADFSKQFSTAVLPTAYFLQST